MARLRLRREALQDLRSIGRYTLDRWGPEQRNNYLRQLDARFRQLSEHPHLGAPRDWIREGYRSARQGRHLIMYREIAGGIEIVRILHENMDVERHLAAPDKDQK